MVRFPVFANISSDEDDIRLRLAQAKKKSLSFRGKR